MTATYTNSFFEVKHISLDIYISHLNYPISSNIIKQRRFTWWMGFQKTERVQKSAVCDMYTHAYLRHDFFLFTQSNILYEKSVEKKMQLVYYYMCDDWYTKAVNKMICPRERNHSDTTLCFFFFQMCTVISVATIDYEALVQRLIWASLEFIEFVIIYCCTLYFIFFNNKEYITK